MNNTITINNQYNSLDSLNDFLQTASTYKCYKEYDIWEQRLDIKGQMEQCLVLKKSNMHAVKLYFTKENTVKLNHIIPNKLMNAYFGKSQKRYQNILEIVTGKIKEVVLAGSQQKAFKELENVVKLATLDASA